MKVSKSLIPEDIQILKKCIICAFIEYGCASKYSGILTSKMFGEYGKLYDYLCTWSKWTPEFFNLLIELWVEDAKDILDVSSQINFESELPRQVKKYFDWYVLQNPTTTMEHLEKVSLIRSKLDAMNKWEQEDTIFKLLCNVEDEIEIAKNRWDLPLWYTTWLESIDKNCEGLQKWTVMRINAYSNTGKSKLSYFICNHLLRQNKKVLYFSLEVTSEKVLMNILANWYKVDYRSLAKWRTEVDIWSFYSKNSKLLEITDKFRRIEDIISYTKLRKPDVVIIDFVQNIETHGNSEYEKMTHVAIEIQRLAIQEKIAVLDLSQISNEWTQYKVGQMIPSKWSGWLVASADVGLMLYKKDNLMKLAIAKNKFWPAGIEINLEVDFSKGIFIDKWTSDDF